ncbi:hypothetical protein BGZ96_000142 [Linnemannia gamsii]|uniref:Cingulin-like n=1 Tax=Linnemannia gamsii TaxID=64522 RepID=A0ABQ7JPK8_9FUNG|nr:hypothetical protein BGZ96_000142 [Linnemannia gamsii]
MVYATRSRSIAHTRTAAPSARATGNPKPPPKKKRPSSSSSSNPLTRRRHSVTKDTTAKKLTKFATKNAEEKIAQVAVDGGVFMTLNTTDSYHGRHIRDGKDHHLKEQGGWDHHHIFFKDFEKIHRPTTTADGGETMDVDLDVNSDVYTLRDGYQVHRGVHSDAAFDHHDAAPAAQPRERRPSTKKTSSSSTHAMLYTTGPAPLVIHVDRSRRKHSLDGVDHHIIEADGRDHHHIRYGDSKSTLAQHSKGRRRASESNVHEASLSSSSHKVAKKSAHSTAAATVHHSPLDSGVLQLQRYLQDKEDALRTAESVALNAQKSTTVRTETLTREVHDLRTTILDLRSHLSKKETQLKTSHGEIETIKRGDQEEIHAVEGHSKKLVKDLEDAKRQKDLLVKQVRDMSTILKTREAELKTVQSSIKGLEKTNITQSKVAKKLSSELGTLKKGMNDKEKELKYCRAQIKLLESDHSMVLILSTQLKSVRDRLAVQEEALKGLEKKNKLLNKDHVKVQQLTGEAQSLTQDVLEAEDMLRKAQSAVDGLVGYRDRAATLEFEVHDLRDQVNTHEKHESDLEDALMRHENCAMESQQLQGAVNLLQARLNKKQSEIQALQNTNDTMRSKDESLIAHLQGEVSALQAEMATHDLAAVKLRAKAAKDLAKISSTAKTLRKEVVAHRQQVKDKTAELKQHDKSYTQRLSQVQSQNSVLSGEIQKLELLITTKNRHASELDSVIANLSKHTELAGQLEGEVLQLQRESKRIADKSAEDLSTMASSSSKLALQIDGLRGELLAKETELRAAEKVAVDLESKSNEMKSSLLHKMSGLENTSKSHLERAKKAEESGKTLRSEIMALKVRLSGLQDQLSGKETDLKSAVDKAEKDHEEGVHRLEEMRRLVAGLRGQMRDAEKETKAQIRDKEGVITALRKQLTSLENHEAAKVDELKREIEKETAHLHQKESQILEFQKKLTEQTHEIGRLNTVVSQTRTELTLNRKRHESEYEESEATKEVLEHQISDLKDARVHLREDEVANERMHMRQEGELEEQVKELLAWRQNATAQTKDQEAVMVRLQVEKVQQTERASGFERQVLDLQHQLQQVTAARTSATEQCTKLTLTISKFEKELKFLKGVIVQHDMIEANTQAHMVNLQGQVQSLDNARVMLQRENEKKDEVIEEVEEKLREAKKEVGAKEKIIHGLHARILDLNRSTTKLQSELEKSESALLKSQHDVKTSQTQIETVHSQIITQTNLVSTLQHQLSTMETKVQHEMSTTKDLTDMLAQLRSSMRRGSDTELKKMDHLEMEIKNRASSGGVEETGTTTQRNRLDSGAFLEHATASSTAAPSGGATTITTAH